MENKQPILDLENEWDIIPLNFEVDVPLLVKWYEEIERKFNDLWFDFSKSDYVIEKYHPENVDSANFDGHGSGDHLRNLMKAIFNTGTRISYMALAWPCEKDIPCPPSWAAKPKLYPEINEEHEYKLQEKFMFGYFKELYEIDSSFFKKAQIIKHDPHACLTQHIDGPGIVRIHIPIITNEECKFQFGEKLEREYHLSPGRAYLVNASIPHGTINGDSTRVHLQTKTDTFELIRLAYTRYL